MKPRLFISYRREDSAGYAALVSLVARREFGNSNVFIDVDSIDAGVDYMSVISHTLASCDVVIVLIGSRWLDCVDNSGHRRIDNPHDLLRLEVEAALRHRDVLVVPLLVDGAGMPDTDSLPPNINELSRRNAFVLHGSRVESSLTYLLRSLEETTLASRHRLILPGRALAGVELGAPERSVCDTFGEPDEISRYGPEQIDLLKHVHTHYCYYRLGLSFLIEKGMVSAGWAYAAHEKYIDFYGATRQGITVRSTRSDVENVYGSPSEPLRISVPTEERVVEIYSKYNSLGIAFTYWISSGSKEQFPPTLIHNIAILEPRPD